ncbi:hypothetical protein SAMN05216251_12393 [Actinacidiphila alni]|uniref:Uncharacterized protein n=1 Tax=Actinacidiphila alni TaxID=380248 RepID=A0A1I2KM96_9ACTN|nr:hypothetical protein [Actinacidiphila alni]SFF66357.1 hypothetical protein SAMN05216251_12393 [Actinacidiphila alni]
MDIDVDAPRALRAGPEPAAAMPRAVADGGAHLELQHVLPLHHINTHRTPRRH